MQEPLFEKLIDDIAEFNVYLEDFDYDFEDNGPQILGITSTEASERCSKYC